jgi:hypothetical protein
MSPVSAGLKNEPRRKLQLSGQRKPASDFANSSALNTEATCSSETAVDFHRTTGRFVPEDRTSSITTAMGTSNSLIQFNIALLARPTAPNSSERMLLKFGPFFGKAAYDTSLNENQQWTTIQCTVILKLFSDTPNRKLKGRCYFISLTTITLQLKKDNALQHNGQVPGSLRFAEGVRSSYRMK